MDTTVKVQKFVPTGGHPQFYPKNDLAVKLAKLAGENSRGHPYLTGNAISQIKEIGFVVWEEKSGEVL